MSSLELIGSFIADFAPVMMFPIIIAVYLLIFFIYYVRVLQPKQGTTEWITMHISSHKLTLLNRRHPITQRDALPLLAITLVFSILAFINLGDSNTVDVLYEVGSPSDNRTHLNNMIFDEVYHVRTAVEHIENVYPYETTHPPLGKELIAASILAFGMTPFGWRLIGALFGVLMLVIMYVFIKNMFGRTVVAVCGTLLFGFDFMRFVQTRIATIDSFTVLFILISFFFMYRYITTDINAPFRKSLLPLALSGLFFGFSVATKWVGFYAGAGLLIIYVIRLFQLGSYYSSTEKQGFGNYLIKTLLFSFLFFAFIPSIFYYLTYIPYGLVRGMSLGGGMLWDPEYFMVVWSNQVQMFSYHSRLVAEHPFSSTWWQWIFNIRPILYVFDSAGDTYAKFGAFGNPVVWLGGFLAMIMMVLRVFTHRDGKALFILIGYLAQLLPWVGVTRILFAYHYFPSSLFLILALAHIFNTILERLKASGKSTVYGYTAVTGTVFAVFYPSLSGMYLPHWYYSTFLKWFGTWPF